MKAMMTLNLDETISQGISFIVDDGFNYIWVNEPKTLMEKLKYVLFRRPKPVYKKEKKNLNFSGISRCKTSVWNKK